MKTLLEFITFVKGVEYLIVVAFCFGFIALWMLAHNKEKGKIMGVVQAVMLLSLVFGGAAVVVATNESAGVALNSTAGEDLSNDNASIAEQNPDTWLKVDTSEYLAITYGPATEFHDVMGEKVSCQKCHHNSGDEIHACKDCHERPFDPEDSDKPGLKAAYHQLCMSCHEDVFSGPESCTSCHNGNIQAAAAFSAPVRPHKLTWSDCSRCHEEDIPQGQEISIVYHDRCLNCHTDGISGAKKLPEDHLGREPNTCDGCHKKGGGDHP